MNYVGLKVPVGRIMGKKLEQLAELAERYGNGEIRISPAQTLVLPNVSDKNPGGLAEGAGLSSVQHHAGVVSCVGSDYCHLAAIETKSRALQVASKREEALVSL